MKTPLRPSAPLQLRVPLRLLPALFVPFLLLSACSGGQDGSPPDADSAAQSPAAELEWPSGSEAASAAITAELIREVTATLASDELAGRAPGSPGDVEARRYIADELEAAGFEPGAEDGSWEQSFEIVGIDAKAPATWSFSAAGKTLELAHWDEFIAASGVQRDQSVIDDAELVFVGYGIDAPEYDWDDFKGAHLEGKVLVMLNNDPDWDEELFAGNRRLYYGRWTYKYESAAAQGAAGAIIVHTTESAGYPWQVVQTSWTGEQFELPAGEEPRIDVAGWTTWEATEKLLAMNGHDLNALVAAARERDFQPVSLGIRTSLTLDNQIRRGIETANVLGILRGSDPELSKEVVIYTGHHDHLGVGQPNAAGDTIYNGARDNASGTGQILAIARAYAALPEAPRRSVLCALVAAEEQGLLGSKHYAQEPTFAPGRIAANVNFDAGNIWGRSRDLVYIGYGKSSLDRIVEAVAAMQDRHVVGDQFPDRGFFYRSDQFSLAKIGVPAMYLDGGKDLRDAAPGEGEKKIEAWEAEHYHQPSDEIDASWSFDGLVEDAQAGFYAGLAVAQADEMPTWNVGDEFEAARKAAIEEIGGR